MPQRLYAHMRSPLGLIIAAYAAMVLIWGSTWLAIKVALTGITPLAGSGVRFVLAALLMYGVGSLLRVDRRANAPLHLILVLAVAMFGIPYALTYVAETQLASGLVAVLFGTVPFLTFGLAFVFLRERLGAPVMAGAIVAFGGVALISLAGNARGDSIFILATLAAAVASAGSNVYLKRFAHAEPLAVLPPAMLLAGVGLSAAGALVEHPHWHSLLATGPLLATLYLAAFGSAIAFYLNHWLLQRISSNAVALSALMIPVLAVGVGALFGGERLEARDLVGGLCVIAGMWLSLGSRRVPQQASLEPAA